MYLQILFAFAKAEIVKDEEYTPITLEESVIWVAVILSGIAITIYVAGFFRGHAMGKIDETANHLDQFRDLRDKGMLDEEEFSQVKTTMRHKQIQQEVGSNEDTSSDAENNNQS